MAGSSHVFRILDLLSGANISTLRRLSGASLVACGPLTQSARLGHRPPGADASDVQVLSYARSAAHTWTRWPMP